MNITIVLGLHVAWDCLTYHNTTVLWTLSQTWQQYFRKFRSAWFWPQSWSTALNFANIRHPSGENCHKSRPFASIRLSSFALFAPALTLGSFCLTHCDRLSRKVSARATELHARINLHVGLYKQASKLLSQLNCIPHFLHHANMSAKKPLLAGHRHRQWLEHMTCFNITHV